MENRLIRGKEKCDVLVFELNTSAVIQKDGAEVKQSKQQMSQDVASAERTDAARSNSPP
jgi:hypothetical protein